MSDLFGPPSQSSAGFVNRYLSGRLSQSTNRDSAAPPVVRGAYLSKGHRDNQLIVELEGFNPIHDEFSERERRLAKLGVLLGDVVLYTIDYNELQGAKGAVLQKHLSQLITLYHNSYLYCPS